MSVSNLDISKKKSKVSILPASRSSITKSFATLPMKSLSRMKVRKQSYGFTGVAGIRTTEKTSQLGFEYKRPILSYLNTYQLDPHVKFNPVHVEKVIDALLDEYFTGYKYSSEGSPTLALQLAGQLVREVKGLNFNRYRIIAVVTIAQKRAQCYSNAVAFLWDHQRDCYANVDREVHTAFIQVTVFGIYLD